ncbi:hypothetical protein [Sulfurovum sp.]|jgi:hypothetical protein|uniref:hypothetical protein n=1 Tax=Sulfurovum sp. TaxID=1969726 RepID=UPI002A368DC2|nr:hypothetical protein [Sulfurovum sp.]MDY0403762.1 hypothetical protein [Sulfurovum sp.]
MNEETKEMLLAQIEKLIAYGSMESTINPVLLEYLSMNDLISMRNNLLEKAGTLSDEDKEWLGQFRRYE